MFSVLVNSDDLDMTIMVRLLELTGACMHFMPTFVRMNDGRAGLFDKGRIYCQNFQAKGGSNYQNTLGVTRTRICSAASRCLRILQIVDRIIIMKNVCSSIIQLPAFHPSRQASIRQDQPGAG